MQKDPKVASRKMRYQGVPLPHNWIDMNNEAKDIWKSAVDQVKDLDNQYTKKITPTYNVLEKTHFEQKVYKKLVYVKYKKRNNPDYDANEEDYFTLEDLERWNVHDITRYNKPELLEMIKDFVQANSQNKMKERL